MWRAALKGALGHRARLVISGAVLTFAVAFVVSTLVFTDTLNRSFETLFQDFFAGFDVQVRSEVDPDLPLSFPSPVDESLLDEIRSIDGVGTAQGTVTGFLAMNDPSGEAVETGDRFGSSLMVGDFNHDRYFDLAIGVPFESVGAIGEAGAVNVIYGSFFGLHRNAMQSDQLWHQDRSGIMGASESGDHFGKLR